MSGTSLPLSYTSNHAHQQFVTSPVALKTTYHICVFSHCLTEKLKYNTCLNATYLETLLGEETESAISSLHGHANQCILPVKNCPGCHSLCHKHCITAAFLQLKLCMSSKCNQIMDYSLQ